MSRVITKIPQISTSTADSHRPKKLDRIMTCTDELIEWEKTRKIMFTSVSPRVRASLEKKSRQINLEIQLTNQPHAAGGGSASLPSPRVTCQIPRREEPPSGRPRDGREGRAGRRETRRREREPPASGLGGFPAITGGEGAAAIGRGRGGGGRSRASAKRCRFGGRASGSPGSCSD